MSYREGWGDYQGSITPEEVIEAMADCGVGKELGHDGLE